MSNDVNLKGFSECLHAKCTPEFDLEMAKGMTSDEVRQRFPRFNGRCPECGSQMIIYASFEHYLSGDW